MPTPILTLYNRHTPNSGTPPTLNNTGLNLYFGYFENPYQEQWIFTFDRETRTATLRGGDADWEKTYIVEDGRVADLILGPEEAAWVQVCWVAAVRGTPDVQTSQPTESLKQSTETDTSSRPTP
jgi:hypothetical protein